MWGIETKINYPEINISPEVKTLNKINTLSQKPELKHVKDQYEEFLSDVNKTTINTVSTHIKNTINRISDVFKDNSDNNNQDNDYSNNKGHINWDTNNNSDFQNLLDNIDLSDYPVEDQGGNIINWDLNTKEGVKYSNDPNIDTILGLGNIDLNNIDPDKVKEGVKENIKGSNNTLNDTIKNIDLNNIDLNTILSNIDLNNIELDKAKEGIKEFYNWNKDAINTIKTAIPENGFNWYDLLNNYNQNKINNFLDNLAEAKNRKEYLEGIMNWIKERIDNVKKSISWSIDKTIVNINKPIKELNDYVQNLDLSKITSDNRKLLSKLEDNLNNLKKIRNKLPKKTPNYIVKNLDKVIEKYSITLNQWKIENSKLAARTTEEKAAKEALRISAKLSDKLIKIEKELAKRWASFDDLIKLKPNELGKYAGKKLSTKDKIYILSKIPGFLNWDFDKKINNIISNNTNDIDKLVKNIKVLKWGNKFIEKIEHELIKKWILKRWKHLENLTSEWKQKFQELLTKRDSFLAPKWSIIRNVQVAWIVNEIGKQLWLKSVIIGDTWANAFTWIQLDNNTYAMVDPQTWETIVWKDITDATDKLNSFRWKAKLYEVVFDTNNKKSIKIIWKYRTPTQEELTKIISPNAKLNPTDSVLYNPYLKKWLSANFNNSPDNKNISLSYTWNNAYIWVNHNESQIWYDIIKATWVKAWAKINLWNFEGRIDWKVTDINIKHLLSWKYEHLYWLGALAKLGYKIWNDKFHITPTIAAKLTSTIEKWTKINLDSLDKLRWKVDWEVTWLFWFKTWGFLYNNLDSSLSFNGHAFKTTDVLINPKKDLPKNLPKDLSSLVVPKLYHWYSYWLWLEYKNKKSWFILWSNYSKEKNLYWSTTKADIYAWTQQLLVDIYYNKKLQKFIWEKETEIGGNIHAKVTDKTTITAWISKNNKNGVAGRLWLTTNPNDALKIAVQLEYKKEKNKPGWSRWLWVGISVEHKF